MDLNKQQMERYSRHILLKDISAEGQQKIVKSRVLIIGAGGLGSSAVLYLAAAGVGTLGLVDGDQVDVSNLQRQVIHSTADIGKPKVLSAKEKILRINPDVEVVVYQQRATADNITGMIRDRDYDFIIDATDNFPSKFLINDACVLEKKAFVHAGVLRFDGQAMTYVPGSACYRCIFGSAPPAGAVPSTAEVGVFGPVPGVMGIVQATEALKYIVGNKEGLLTNRLLVMNLLTMHFKTITVKKDPQCPVCGKDPAAIIHEGKSSKL